MIKLRNLLALALTFVAALAAGDASRDFANAFNNRLSAGTAAFTTLPASVLIWGNSDTATTNDVFFTVGDSSVANHLYTLGITNAGRISCYGQGGAGQAGPVTSTSFTVGPWFNGGCVFNSTTDRRAYLNGGGKVTDATLVTVSGVNATAIGGAVNASTGFNADARLAHAAVWSRALTDLEWAYLGAGGSPRYVPDLTHYWKLNGANPEADEIGAISLTVNSSSTAASNPTIATAFTGSTYSTQTWSEDDAISSLSADARFDDVDSAFTTSFKALGTAASDTTASGAGSSSRELTVASATNLAAGDYIKITAGGSPTLVLHKIGSVLLLATARTWSNADTVYEFPVNNASIAGVSLSAGSISGTPTTPQASTPNYFVRATNNATATLIADSNLFSIEVTVDAVPPTFSVSPTVQSQTTTAYTLQYTPSQSTTFYAIARETFRTAATCTQIKAGNHSGGSAALASVSEAVTGADTTVLGGSLTRPMHSIDMCLSDAGGDSSVVTLTNEMLDAPAGKQYVTLASVSGTSWCADVNVTATPDIAAGDILKIDTATDPDAFTWTQQTDCNGNYSGTSARQLVTYDVYDTSVGAYMAGGPGKLWFNNQAPLAPTPGSVLFFVPLNSAMTPANVSLCTDSEGDDIVVEEVDALPAGLEIVFDAGDDRYELQGTATVQGIYRDLIFKCTDITGAETEWQ